MGDNNHSTPTGAPLQPGSPVSREAPANNAGSASSASRPSSRLTPCQIHLSFDDVSALVLANLSPSPQATVITLEGLRAQLSEAGYGAFYAPTATLEALVQQANSGKAGQLVVAERRDARMEWHISRDRMTAELTLHAAWGGRAVTDRDLAKALQDQGVPQACWLRKTLGRVLRQGHAEAVIVARAVPPKEGQNTRFHSLVAREEDLNLEEDARGRVDLYHLHDFVVVEPGTPLMRRLPATAGEPGLTVLGEPLAPKAGRDRPFDPKSEGVSPAPDDPDLLVADIRGHPVFSGAGVRVDPTLRLKAVGLESGNIDFDGSVEVAGDVGSGFVVKATGDIVVRGMVEKADVSAGGSLAILGGVMGEEVGKRHDGDLQLRTHLSAGGILSAKFINLAEVRAKGDIHVREYVLQSRLKAGQDIVLGQPTGKGSLIGGWAHAGRAVIVNRLGSEAGVATEVSVGRPPEKSRRLQSLKQALELCEHNWHKVVETLQCIERGERSAPASEKHQRLYVTRDALRTRRQRLLTLIERLASRRQSSDTCRVEVKRQQHANISLTVDGVRRYDSLEHGPSCWVRIGAELLNRP
ncbi:DUF342 domain-containing protein [Marinimicrobium agarilyticum]|uniref:DUF342 domain-containing protein n=1 Tax=Marinimicrobium agarilyticum TaxID=306546 RepID=UPI00146F5081|nr:FapA family protein [Marinimicrobium agarilyticum]